MMERALRLPERSGDRWHRALLADATRPLPGVRPIIVPVEAERDWDDLLSFRHFLRHAYAAELDAQRLARAVGHLRRAVTTTAPLMGALLHALAIEPR